MGLLAGIAFLVVSAPLSTWTLPNLVLAAALLVMLRREHRPEPSDEFSRPPRSTARLLSGNISCPDSSAHLLAP